jgi:hypothetical protein
MPARTGPAALLCALALFVAAGVVPGADAGVARAAQPAATQDLPDAASLFEKHIAAIGGQEKIRSITTRVVEGAIVAGAGANRTVSRITLYQQAPNRLLAVVENPAVSTLELGYDGTHAWVRDLSGTPRLVTGADADGIAASADFYAEAEYKTMFREMSTVGRERFGDRAVFRVRAVERNGQESFRLFDAETGLLTAVIRRLPGAQAGSTVEQVTEMGEWQEFGGVRFPTLQVQRAEGQAVATRVRVVDTNVPVPEVQTPADVQALIAAGPATGGTSPANAPATPPASAPAAAPGTPKGG